MKAPLEELKADYAGFHKDVQTMIDLANGSTGLIVPVSTQTFLISSPTTSSSYVLTVWLVGLQDYQYAAGSQRIAKVGTHERFRQSDPKSEKH